MLLNYLLECHISMTFQKIQKNFRSLCTLVIKIHESCCSIFNELCFFAASPCGSQLIYYTTLSFVCQEVFQTFFKFFSSSRLPPTLRCRSLAAPIVYHILPRLSTPFCKFFQDFSIFPAGKVTALGLWVLYWLHQWGIPRHTCRFYWLLAGAVEERQGISIPYPSPTPLLTPWGSAAAGHDCCRG